MPARDLNRDEMAKLLRAERVVRLAFASGDERYLIPLGYVWMDEAIWCVTKSGRKTRLAREDSRVAFQVDDSARTGVFDWRSVTGQGIFTQVLSASRKSLVLAALYRRFRDMPEWARREYAGQESGGELILIRIQPTEMTGREYRAPEETR